MRRVAAALLYVCVAVILTGCGRQSMINHNRDADFFTIKDLYTEHAWLKDEADEWRLAIDTSATDPTYSDLASFPLGNGEIFGINGLSLPLGSVTNITGPGYQKQAGFYSACVPGLRIGGQQQDFPKQAVAWLQKAGVIHTRLQNDRAILHVFDWVPEKQNLWYRLLVAESTGQEALEDVELILGTVNPATVHEEMLSITRARSLLRMGCVGRCEAEEEGFTPNFGTGPEAIQSPREKGLAHLSCPIGSIDRGASGGKLFYMALSTEKETGDDSETVAPPEDVDISTLEATRDAYLKWHEKGLQVHTGNSRLDQFLEIQKHIVKVQQAAQGGFSPMHKYTYTWVRDSVGPVRYFLQCGYFDAVKRYLQYQYLGNAHAKEIRLNLSLTINTDTVTVPEWSEVPVERAEVPSYIVLQHYWYYRHTGDAELIKKHWDYLKRCIDGQQVSSRGTLPFHSDETYRFPGYESFRQGREVESYVQLECQSADSAFEYVAAADAMAQMARELGKNDRVDYFQTKADFVRNATEKYYWMPGDDREYYAPAMSDFTTQRHRYPFASINMRPMWIGYADLSDRQRMNVINSLKYLWQEDGTVWPAPDFGYYTTMVPGFVLYNLAELDSDLVPSALEQLWEAAEASGGFAEMNTPDNEPAEEIWGRHRCRPWEGGINAHAVVHALMRPEVDAVANRLSLAPRQLGGMPAYRVQNIPVGKSRVSVDARIGKNKHIYDFDSTGSDMPPVLDLNLRVPSTKIIAIDVPMDQQGADVRRDTTEEGYTYIDITRLQLIDGETVPVEITFQTQHPGHVVRRPTARFFYGTPNIEGDPDTLLLTWNPEVYSKYRQDLGERMHAFDTKIPWPMSYLRAGLFEGPGQIRFDRVILDTETYNGAFKRKGFWKDGAGGKILEEFRTLGGTVEKSKYASTLPPSYRNLPREGD